MADQILFTSFAYTYVLFLSNGEWTIGSTDDLHRRLKRRLAFEHDPPDTGVAQPAVLIIVS